MDAGIPLATLIIVPLVHCLLRRGRARARLPGPSPGAGSSPEAPVYQLGRWRRCPAGVSRPSLARPGLRADGEDWWC
ncbi:hypothetical protein CSB93_2079 [Pseudomonas paraeruginosa]|uniref:Uncharacterized protein n=1 Tax=Pseudomonas paraeruginosa TaxID=2994495 RepID=A0A2R3IP10_9PSED|nr:hypothetical protein CSB93_2079 [Pseudomonas paraeruginosa]AWE90899.1 hypothetical protein CSC28_0845 [Pseudomonas paraeruginosa]